MASGFPIKVDGGLLWRKLSCDECYDSKNSRSDILQNFASGDVFNLNPNPFI